MFNAMFNNMLVKIKLCRGNSGKLHIQNCGIEGPGKKFFGRLESIISNRTYALHLHELI